MLSHSPFGDDRLSSCLRVIGANDALLLTGDAVYALQPGWPCNALNARHLTLFVLAAGTCAGDSDTARPSIIHFRRTVDSLRQGQQLAMNSLTVGTRAIGSWTRMDSWLN